jgi:hypothetical protein
MPDKPTWYGRLDEIVSDLEALPYPWVDRHVIEQVLRVGRRRAQQILQPCVTHQIGANGVADRVDLIGHLRRLAAGDTALYERQRRRKLGVELERLQKSWTSQPRVLVDAPISIVNQDIAGLPDGVRLEPGKITIQFTSAQQALEQLLAIAMAAGNHFDAFQRVITPMV